MIRLWWYLFGFTSGISLCAAAFYLAILLMPDEDNENDCDFKSGPW